MSKECDDCIALVSSRGIGPGSVKARLTIKSGLQARSLSTSRLRPVNTAYVKLNENLSSLVTFKSKETLTFSPNRFVSTSDSFVNTKINATDIAFHSRLLSSSKFENTFTNKLSGPLSSFERFVYHTPSQKLYPYLDITKEKDGFTFVNEQGSDQSLYESISDGIIEDEFISNQYIQPSSLHATTGSFKYKFDIGNLWYRPDETYLAFRAISPLRIRESKLTPVYRLSDIKLEDPSGNLVVQYKDLTIKGDADYNQTLVNYTTYVTEPVVNNSKKYTWDEDYLIFGSGTRTENGLSLNTYPGQVFLSGYSISFDLKGECEDDPFNAGFNFGYQEANCDPKIIIKDSDNDYLAIDGNAISTQSEYYHLHPLAETVRITAIELQNTGPLASILDTHLPFYVDVVSNGRTINRKILPNKVLYDYDTSIYPSVDTRWQSSIDYDGNIIDNVSGNLREFVRTGSTGNYITLENGSESGKLKLQFALEAPTFVNTLTGGSFSFGQKDVSLSTAQIKSLADVDNFFTISNVELKVIAKKHPDTEDFGIDLVGYSDDKLLCVTPGIGGFLQNLQTTSEGTFPTSSGFGVTDELGISTESLSDKSQYFEDGSNNLGGDHYVLSTQPAVTGTEFQTYTIPLKIYGDSVELGKSKDYSMSSFFENLYVDIYPIPSGASIANIYLNVSYKPANALALHSIGQASNLLEHRDIFLFPSSGLNDDVISYYSEKLSNVQNIPHAFKTGNSGRNGDTTLKTNYTRRWRGAGDKVVTAFNNELDYSFRKDFIKHPFLNYYDFNSVTSSSVLPFNISETVYPNHLSASGFLNRIESVGSRFISTDIFNKGLTNKTIDWVTDTSDGLYGKIHDSYDSAVRVSGSDSYLYTNNTGVLDSGFAAFIRFSPDEGLVGPTHNLYNSGVIFGQFDSDLSYALAFSDGYLAGYAKDINDNIIQINDTIAYDEYSYPLSVILTYNDNNDNKLRLYTDNEIAEEFTSLRATSEAFEIQSFENNPLTIGYSRNSGIGMEMFVTDFGMSFFSEDEPVLGKLNESGVNSFFDDIRLPFVNQKSRYKLWQRIDNDADTWHLGAFNICGFNIEFDRFTKRVGSDYIFHYLKHDGISYEDRCDLDLPSSIPSGLAYHTQVENDMLRIPLSAKPNSSIRDLYSPLPRISKNLPRGYNFEKEAFVAETIIEYDSFDTIIWEDGNVGPRLTVSLYTNTKDPVSYEAQNYGLVNRYFHYLEPSGCFRKISSIFDANSFLDEETEQWSNFAESQRVTEFNHKYFSKDIDDMFLQYDIAYPSGSSFESVVKIHAVNVKLKEALVGLNSANNSFDLYTSGEQYFTSHLNMFATSSIVLSSGLNLAASGEKYESSGILGLRCSGAVLASDSLPLHGITIGTVSTNGNGLFGAPDPTFGFSLFIDGRVKNDQYLPLYVQNEKPFADESFNLFVYNQYKPSSNASLDMHTRGQAELVNFTPNASFNLFTHAIREVKTQTSFTNLYLAVEDSLFARGSGAMNLFTVNYAPPVGIGSENDQSVKWDGQNVGVGITVEDNKYAFLDADDEIRGVKLVCYGDCNSEGTCTEVEINTHDTIWRDSTCVNGGIFRPLNVYTNLDTSGFKTDVGYSGHFYGIRKFEGLIPNAPYNLTLTGRTASAAVANVPREIDTIEYGENTEIAFSGTKMTNYVENDQYGKSISISKDLMTIGAPHHTVQDNNGNDLVDAGTVFVYRRDPQPIGYDWDYDKAPWQIETELKLPFPSGDYIRNEVQIQFKDSTNKTIGEVTERIWRVGQEGRQFGHSVSAYSGDDREIIVTSGPSAKWTRQFEDLEPSGVNIGLFVFTDEFTAQYSEGGIPPKTTTYTKILSAIKDKDILFKYFAEPFPTKFNVKILVFDCNADRKDGYVSQDFPEPKPEGFVYKRLLHRHLGNEAPDQGLKIYSGIYDAFHEAFPYDTGELNNNIPALIGFFVDDSASFGTKAIQPELNKFIKYYEDYSLASGLVDFYNQPSKGGTTIYQGSRENWILESIDVLNHTLDTGRLVREDQDKLFARTVGQFNKELKEFNDPPPSGGAVYIFEKEDDDWNLIQTIDSPNDSNIIAPDRFGHAVKISKNGEVIVVGSPYISQAFGVYQYDPREKDRMYKNVSAWVDYHRETAKPASYYWRLKERYDDLVDASGEYNASRILYKELTSEAKYDLRSNYTFWQGRGGSVDENPNYYSGYYKTSKTGTIQEYENIYTYGYGNIPYVGSWGFILEQFCPTSRLGYSVAVNEDGSIVALGAPTDSLNEYEDRNVYYLQTESEGKREAYSTWPSYVNAGAVRVFESRQYFPHHLAMEYGKFGNLAYENRRDGEDQYFEHMTGIYNGVINRNIGQRVPFIKTPFSETEIPEEAGLVFIITPAVDALSDEVLTNIREWLALGDRHLVLVGEDPVWEREGLYSESNKVINKILRGLNSRLVINPARNEFEALSTSSEIPTKPNVIPSTRPSTPRNGGRSNYIIAPEEMYGIGVGDIKMYAPGTGNVYDCTLSNDPFFANSDLGIDISYQALNGKCKIPMYHNGDLRAEWYEACMNEKGQMIAFPTNWGLLFGTYIDEDFGCAKSKEPRPVSPTAGYDAIPFLAAAEYPEPYDIIYPAVPPASSLVPVEFETRVVDTITSAKYGKSLNDEKQFLWSASAEDSIMNAADINIGSKTNPDRFYDPIAYNNKDPLLQAKATNKIKTSEKKVQVYSPCYLVTKEKVDTSNVFLIAGLETETSAYLNAGNDQNIYLYRNIIQDGFSDGVKLHIAQLGAWTGRNKFTDAKEDSILAALFNNLGHKVDEGVSKLVSTAVTYNYDICWIANPKGLPNEQQLKEIKDWLAKGNKKIIITYQMDGDISGYDPDYTPDGSIGYDEINNAKELCRLLGSTMSPLYLNAQNRYALSIMDGSSVSNSLAVNQNAFIGKGYPETDRDNIERLPYDFFKNFVPINKGDGEGLVYFEYGLMDIEVQRDTIWQMKAGVAQVNFPVLPGSGYTVFVDLCSESAIESVEMVMDISNCSRSPTLGNVSSGQDKGLYEYDENDNKISIKSDKIGISESVRFDAALGKIETKAYQLQVGSSNEDLSIYFSANDLRLINPNDQLLRTSRVVSISGSLLEVKKETQIITEQVPIRWDWVITSEGSPERTQTVTPPMRQISTDNTKYCPTQDCADVLGNQLIEDGPIVLAQELEQFSSFKYGENRSRVTVISDSSLVQGRCIANENGSIRDGVVQLLQSLYPPNPSTFVSRGRQFTISTKIQSPERLSPHKLYSSTGNEGHRIRFSGTGFAATGLAMTEFDEKLYDPTSPGFDRPLELRSALEYDFLIPLPENVKRTEEDIAEIENQVINTFLGLSSHYGGAPKFSGVIDGKLYADASYHGGIPEIMKDTGYDYLDFERFPSGYPGDLFGYSIDLYKEKLVVGAPFAAFSGEAIQSWYDVSKITQQGTPISGVEAGYNGGAGAVYVFEKTGKGLTLQENLTNWECTRKIRPDSINVGQDIDDIVESREAYYLGDNDYSSDDLLNEAIINDQFGYSVDIDSDMLIVGAPGHDFANYIEITNTGEFINKAFGDDLDIRRRMVHDIGESGYRNTLAISGSGTTAVLNNGAVYVYENRIYDWINKLQKWEFVEKVVPQGNMARSQRTYVGFPATAVSGSENDYFGKSIAIDRTRRTDADYVLIVGAPHHKFDTDGDAPLLNAGAVYSFDSMLREKQASKADPNAWIDARVFGGSGVGYEGIRINFSNGYEISKQYKANGIVYTNDQGEIFLEASGQDPLIKGFIVHRPYIESVKGSYVFGTPEDGTLRLFADGKPPTSSGDMNLFIESEYGNVYNTLGLYGYGVSSINSGVMNLYLECPTGIEVTGSLPLIASGANVNTDTLNISIRGK